MAALSGYSKKTHFHQRWHTRCAFRSNQDSSPLNFALNYYLLLARNLVWAKGSFSRRLFSVIMLIIVHRQILPVLFVFFLVLIFKHLSFVPEFRTRRLIEKNMLSLLIYTFPNKVEKRELVSLPSLAAVFWMSRNTPGGALRDIQKTAARETRELVCSVFSGPVALQPRTRHFTKVHST